MSLPPAPHRFIAETRLSMGRPEFDQWLASQAAVETRTALYSREAQGREIAAGRAQVWLELKDLFTSGK